ncbi:MAG TPA: hypothetical protein VHV83_17380 [Armatimonadota bacterium]|nr:hypothetical protein [Armatimonadota bacterium]
MLHYLDPTSCATVVILGLLVIWWLLRSGDKHPSQRKEHPQEQPLFMDMPTPGIPTPQNQPEDGSQEQQVIQNLEKKLAEMDEKISRMNQNTPASGPMWPRNQWGSGMYPASGERQALMPSPELIRAEVYRLSDTGQNVMDIAKTLNISRGEVELLLSMRGQ